MGRERTFGARWPVMDLGPAQRDMKRGPIAVPDPHRGQPYSSLYFSIRRLRRGRETPRISAARAL